MRPSQTLGDRLRIARNAAGMSMDELADALGTSKTTVSKWENDAMHPRVEQLPELRRVLAVTLDHLICGDAVAPNARSSWQVNETPATYDAGKLTPRDMRSIRMRTLFERLNEPQQKSLIEVASNFTPPARPAAKPAIAAKQKVPQD